MPKRTTKKPSERLGDYRNKRDPARTNEPFAAEQRRSAGPTLSGRFVVHLHAATRTHYDLRLQIGGALESFAVPKGPSLDPDQKHLAVRTEVHPLEYVDFEDVIPEGNYGAGPMIVWDQGTVRYLDGPAEEEIERGKLDFELAGYKLRGRFALVDTGRREKPPQPNWLLIKKSDAFAVPGGSIVDDEPHSVLSGLTVAELPERERVARELEQAAADLGAPVRDVDAAALVPMLCADSGAGLDEADRLYELKLDGARILAERRGTQVALRYRNGRVATGSYPEIARAVGALAETRVVLDGEIVAFDDAGRPSLQRLLPRIQARRPLDVRRAAAEVPVAYVVFDVLQIGDRSVVGLPLRDRKALLQKLVVGRGLLRALDHIEGDGQALFDFCRERDLEGVVAKRAGSRYRPGPVRSGDWVKIKRQRDDELVVVGWVTGKGSRKRLGALDLGSYAGERLIYRGKVGSGLDQTSLQLLEKRLREIEVDSPAFEGELPREAGTRHFVRPELVVSVRYLGFTEEGRLREPVFRGVRADVAPAQCTVAPADEVVERAEVEPAQPAAEGRVRVTNRDKVFWPADGYTKGDLCDYYAAVAPVLLPFLKSRPVVLVRYPDGIEGKSFFQWNAPAGTPEWIRTLQLRDEEDPDHHEKCVFLVEDVDSLLHIANLGCIPIHVLASREQSLGQCDFLTIDLDIGEQPFRDAVVLALSLRELLDEIGLPGYPKTSGQSGLHVLIPLGPGVKFEVAKILVELIGRCLQLRHPEMSTMERRISERGARVYIDTGQTGRSRTIVAPYSVRARPGATVSTPLGWDEVHMALDPARFSMFNVLARVEELGDPLADLLDERPDVPEAVARLEALMR